jgi:hypothetical protein
MSSIGRFGIKLIMSSKSLGYPVVHLHGSAKIVAALLMLVINAACAPQPLCVICKVKTHSTADVVGMA